MIGKVSPEKYEEYRTSDLSAIERARGMNLELSDRQWKILELENFPHCNIWRYDSEHPIYSRKPFVWLMCAIKPQELKHISSQVSNLDGTFVVKEIHEDNCSLSWRHKPFTQWINEQRISWSTNFVRAEDVYSNSVNCFAIIFKNQEDLLLTKMTWV